MHDFPGAGCASRPRDQGEMEMGQRQERGKVYCGDWRRWCYRESRRGGGIGIFLVIIGGLWLGAELGFFNPAIFWPLFFITVGTWIIVSSVLRGKSEKPSK